MKEFVQKQHRSLQGDFLFWYIKFHEIVSLVLMIFTYCVNLFKK